MALPDDIPHFRIYSINFRGLVDEKRRDDKLTWLKLEARKIQNLGLVLIQETHFKSTWEANQALRRLGGKLLGISCAQNNSRGVLFWIPSNSPVIEMVEDVSKSNSGRWSVIRVVTAKQHLHITNIYAPADSTEAREEFFSSIMYKLEDYTNMIVGGDWNFCTDSIDIIKSLNLMAE